MGVGAESRAGARVRATRSGEYRIMRSFYPGYLPNPIHSLVTMGSGVRSSRFAAAAVVLAACGGNSNITMNTGPDTTTHTSTAYTCVGQALPTTAASTVTISGTVTDVSTAIAGATVAAFSTGNATALSSTTTAADGSYSISVSTGGTPLDGYLRISKSTYDTTYLYPSAPLVASVSGAKVVLLTPTQLGFLALAAGVTLSSTDGLIVITVVDCTAKVLGGATVSSNPAAGATRYNSGGAPKASATATDVDGLAYLLNVPAGNVTVQGMSGSVTLRSHSLNARAGAITQTILAPGPTTPPE